MAGIINFVLLATLVASATAACNYKIEKLQITTCDGKPNDVVKLKDIKVNFNDKCNIEIHGCAEILKTIKTATADYVALKNGLQVLKEKKPVCNVDLFGIVVECPLNKGKNICADNKWVVELPKGMLAMAVGEIKATAKMITDVGTYCYKGSGTIKK